MSIPVRMRILQDARLTDFYGTLTPFGHVFCVLKGPDAQILFTRSQRPLFRTLSYCVLDREAFKRCPLHGGTVGRAQDEGGDEFLVRASNI